MQVFILSPRMLKLDAGARLNGSTLAGRPVARRLKAKLSSCRRFRFDRHVAQMFSFDVGFNFVPACHADSSKMSRSSSNAGGMDRIADVTSNLPEPWQSKFQNDETAADNDQLHGLLSQMNQFITGDRPLSARDRRTRRFRSRGDNNFSAL
jgi:hypothetical protein